MDAYKIKEWVRETLVDFSIWLLITAEPSRHEGLSMRLHNVADQYARRPTGEWRGH